MLEREDEPAPAPATTSGETVAERSPIRRRQRPLPLDKGAQVGRFVVLGPLGAGGMGAVWLAYDPELDRKVALKLLHTTVDDGVDRRDAQQRLLREAQAAARLTHPNVVAVHDVGNHADQVFVALEYVEGVTLREWQKAKQRPARELIAMYLQAARGLAAAHTAGLVHRDFKPDNVLVGKDGRARVTDFGLARLADDVGDDVATADDDPSVVEASARPLSTPLTGVGAVMGTPGFIAPELYRAEPADARSDQFAFCAALYGALYEVRAFAGKTIDEITEHVKAGTLTAPKRTDVPRWLRPIVVRGLAVAAAERHASMNVLIAALERDPVARRRRIAVGAVSVGAIATLALVLARSHGNTAAPCTGSESALAGVWDDATKAAITARFTQAAPGQAPRSLAIVTPALDDLRRRWLVQHHEACEATRVRGTQSEQVMTLRMVCLDRRLHALGAVVDVFRQADPATVTRGPLAVAALERPEDCADLAALTASTPLPSDPARRAQIEASFTRLAQADTQRVIGKFAASKQAATAELATADTLGFRPLQSRAHEVLDRVLKKLGELKPALEQAQRALWAAEAGDDDAAKLAALGDLILIEGALSRFDEGSAHYQHALAVLERHDDPLLRAHVFASQASNASLTGDWAQCQELNAKAMDLVVAQQPDNPNRYVYEEMIATCLMRQSHYEESLQHADHALEGVRRVFGPDHPAVAEYMVNRAQDLVGLGQNAKALDAMHELLDVSAKANGTDNPRYHTYYINVALYLANLGKYDEALAVIDRELPALEKLIGPETYEVGLALGDRVVALQGLGKYAEAMPDLQRGLAIALKLTGPGKSFHVFLSLLEADGLAHTGHRDEATARCRQVIGWADADDDPGEAVTAGRILGQTLVAQGKYADAVEASRAAIARCDARKFHIADCGLARTTLARALHETGTSTSELAPIIDAARADFAGTDEASSATGLADLAAWQKMLAR
jgi:tetratricopeptide (TPR) repeat protein